MSRPVLPPDYVKVEVDWLYDHHEIKEPAKIFYMQLRGLAWGKDCTPWLKMDEIEELTGKKHSVIWGYMSTLRTYRRLSWRTSGDGSFMYTFIDPSSESSELLRKFGSASTTTNNKDIKIESNNKEEEPTPKVRSVPKVRSTFPTSPLEAVEHPDIKVFSLASERVPGSAQYRVVIETIAMLRKKHNVSDNILADILKPYWAAWSTRKRKDGQLYNPSAITWLTEWAVNGNIPPVERDKLVSSGAVSERNSILKRMAENAKRP